MQTGVIYARVSSVGERQNTERQVIDLREYAIAMGLAILIIPIVEIVKLFQRAADNSKKAKEEEAERRAKQRD